MGKPPAPSRRPPVTADRILDPPDATLLDLLDRLLDTGAMLSGDVTLGVAGVDLIYLRLSALLCAADRILPAADRRLPRGRRSRTARRRRE